MHREPKEEVSLDTSKCKSQAQVPVGSQIEEETRDLQDRRREGGVGEGKGSAGGRRSRGGTNGGQLTVDLLACPSSVLGHVDPDSSSDGTHLLASVAKEGLKLLRGTSE